MVFFSSDFYRRIGARVMNFFKFIAGVSQLGLQTLTLIWVRPFGAKRMFEQAKKFGVDSFPIVSLVSFFIGMILALQTAYIMLKMSSEIYIASIVAVSLTRELGPVITALIVAGRCGAGITAELGTMSVTEQVDALQT